MATRCAKSAETPRTPKPDSSGSFISIGGNAPGTAPTINGLGIAALTATESASRQAHAIA
jgi:hypothetical protein